MPLEAIVCKSCSAGMVQPEPDGKVSCDHCGTRHIFDSVGEFVKLGRKINTDGGTYIEGGVNTKEFVGRDKKTIVQQVVSANMPRSVAVKGNMSDSVVITGDNNQLDATSLDFRVKEKGSSTIIRYETNHGSGKLTLTKEMVVLDREGHLKKRYPAPWRKMPTVEKQKTTSSKAYVRFTTDEEFVVYKSGRIKFLNTDWEKLFDFG